MSRRTSAASKAIREAWDREKQLVLEGKGTRDWTPEQQKSIIEKGKAYDEDGIAFQGHHMKSVEAYPQYQADAGNIQFLSRAEHLDAHGGSFQNTTNGYYDFSTKVTKDFENNIYVPCKAIELRNAFVHTESFKNTEANIMQRISDECERRESVTGGKLRDIDASLSHAQEQISEWDQLEAQIARYEQEMISLRNRILQIGSNLSSGSADNSQADAALRQMKEYQAMLHDIGQKLKKASDRKAAVRDELNQSRKTLKDSIDDIEHDYLDNKEMSGAIADYRKKAVEAAEKARKISALTYGSAFEKVVREAERQMDALDGFANRITRLLRYTVERVQGSLCSIDEIRNRIGDEDAQFGIGERTLHQ